MAYLAEKVTKNTLSIIVIQTLAKLAGLAFVLSATNYLGPDGFGVYSFAMAFTAFFYIFTTLGLFNIEIREISRNKESASLYLASALALKLLLALLSLVFLAASIFIFEFDAITTRLILLMGASVIIDSLFNSLISVLIAFERMGWSSFLSNGAVVLRNVLGVALLYHGADIVNVAQGWLASSIIFALIGLILMKKIGVKVSLKPDSKIVRFLLKETWPFALSSVVFVGYYRADVILLSMMQGNEQVGVYSAAYRLWDVLILLPMAFISAIIPSYSRLAKESLQSFSDMAKKAIKYLALMVFPLSILAFHFSPKIVSYLGKGFEESSGVLSILLLAFTFYVMRQNINNIVNVVNKQKYIFYSDILSLTINIAFNLALIPLYGFLAAAWVMVLSEATAFMYISGKAKEVIDLPAVVDAIKKPLLASLAMLAVVLIAGNINSGQLFTFALLPAFSLAAFAGLVYATQCISSEEWRKVTSSLKVK